jgi:N-acetylmuramoyl-L-alanine amidase
MLRAGYNMLDSRRFLLMLLFPLLLCQAAWGKPAILDIRLGRHAEMTRLVLELSQPEAYRVGLLASPTRLYVELPDSDWHSGQLPAVRGLIRSLAVRSDGGMTRLTARLGRPVKLRSIDLIGGSAGSLSRRLVIDLLPATSGEFAQALGAGPLDSNPPLVVAGPPAAQSAETASAADTPVVTAATPMPMPAASWPADLPKLRPESALAPALTLASADSEGAMSVTESGTKIVSGASVSAPLTGLAVWPSAVPRLKPTASAVRLPLIYIDPGHGGIDPGTIGDRGTYEKDIVLAMAKELQRQLLATGRYRVKLTRERDQFVALRPRFEMARADHADLFISLHANSRLVGDPRGLSVYTLSETGSDSEADALAAKENKADLIAGVDLTRQNVAVTSILIDLVQRETKNLSAHFAELLDHELGRVTSLLSNPHRFAGFAVLKAPDVPSVLIELGYLSNVHDEALLLSPGHRAKLATAMLRAIEGYFTVLASSRS